MAETASAERTEGQEEAQDGDLTGFDVQQESGLGLQRRQGRNQRFLNKSYFLSFSFLNNNNKQPMERNLVKAFLCSSFI